MNLNTILKDYKFSLDNKPTMRLFNRIKEAELILDSFSKKYIDDSFDSLVNKLDVLNKQFDSFWIVNGFSFKDKKQALNHWESINDYKKIIKQKSTIIDSRNIKDLYDILISKGRKINKKELEPA